jgi:hypothetical protein
MAAVFETKLPPPEKLVLIALADHARDDGTGAYPSIATLATKTSMSERGVRDILRRLETRSYIVATSDWKGGRGNTTEYSITLEKGQSGSLFAPRKGEPRSPFTKAKEERGASQRGNLTALKGEPDCTTKKHASPQKPENKTPSNLKGEPDCTEPSLTVLREPVAVRLDCAKHIEPSENPVPQPNLFQEVGKKKTQLLPVWVKGEVAEDLYHGVHGEAIRKAFFDSRFLKPKEQLTECVHSAITSIVTARVRRLKVLRADDIERIVLTKLLPGLDTLSLVKDFEARQRQIVQAIERTLVQTCVEMLANHPAQETEAVA